jgi:Sulfotransferase family
MQNLPTFFIIGAMKCATSTLHEQLSVQSGIFMTALKEPNFFSDDDQYKKGLPWYTTLFDGSGGASFRGESSTHYTKLPTYPETVARLSEHVPHAKFIYIMRHPVDRLVSHYVHEWSQRVISTDINSAIAKHPELIAYSQYARQLEPYLRTFGASRILPVFFERMLAEPQSELERICTFLGFERHPVWDHSLQASNVSSERMRTCVWRDAVVNAPIVRTLRRTLVPKPIRQRIKRWWMLKSKPQLSEFQLERLTAEFDADLRRVGSWVSLPLNCDNFKSVVRSGLPGWSGEAHVLTTLGN